MKKHCLLIIGALFLCASSHAINSAVAITEVRLLLKDTSSDTSLQRHSDDTIERFLSLSQRELVTQTWCLDTTTSVALVSHTTYYTLPNDYLATKTVRFVDSSGRTRRLEQKSYKSVLESNPDYERQSGPPMQYFIRPATSTTAIGTILDEISFLPVPTSASTGTAYIEYYNQAANVDPTNEFDELLDGQIDLRPYTELVVYRTVARIKVIEGDATGAAFYSQMYSEGVKAMNSRLGEMPDYNPSFSAGSSLSSGSPR